ncbi:DUF6194 family protein [Kineosporia babensis]|uniref:DUF6194 family protein n=1 Tax=Kineosporia babensis TaxID=499548 RepID=A0A9X1NHS6_9ACTN|nr:DUF6194 family protein [Kineosporia babensis]MCD5314285.1 DUF6194 family protein [Kineosporia babensis]
MTVDEITAFIEALGGVQTLRPSEGDGTPEIAWGDRFFTYAPDGSDGAAAQPFTTIVTKDYPDEPPSGLDRPEAFRVNLHVGTEEFVARIGRDPKAAPGDLEPLSATDDVFFAHPSYGTLGWIAVKNPSAGTELALQELITKAHAQAKHRHDRRAGA